MVDFHGYTPIAQEFLRIENQIESLDKFKLKSVHDFQISSFVTQYINVLICRTIEGSIKNIIYTRAVIRGFNPEKIISLEKKLKEFRTPEWGNIKDLFLEVLNIEVTETDLGENAQALLSSLGEIVKERHYITHSSPNFEISPTNKTIAQIKTHFENIKLLIDILCDKIEEKEISSNSLNPILQD